LPWSVMTDRKKQPLFKKSGAKLLLFWAGAVKSARPKLTSIFAPFCSQKVAFPFAGLESCFRQRGLWLPMLRLCM
jgi:hypothetical protein